METGRWNVQRASRHLASSPTRTPERIKRQNKTKTLWKQGYQEGNLSSSLPFTRLTCGRWEMYACFFPLGLNQNHFHQLDYLPCERAYLGSPRVLIRQMVAFTKANWRDPTF